MNRPSSPEKKEAHSEPETKMNERQDSRRPPKKRPPHNQGGRNDNAAAQPAARLGKNKRSKYDEERLQARRASNRASAAKSRLRHKQIVAVLENMLATERNEKEMLRVQLEACREENNQLRAMIASEQQVALERNQQMQRLLLQFIEQAPLQQESQELERSTTAGATLPNLVRPARSTRLSDPTHPSYFPPQQAPESTRSSVQASFNQGRQEASAVSRISSLRHSLAGFSSPIMLSNEQESLHQTGHQAPYSNVPGRESTRSTLQGQSERFLPTPSASRSSLRGLTSNNQGPMDPVQTSFASSQDQESTRSQITGYSNHDRQEATAIALARLHSSLPSHYSHPEQQESLLHRNPIQSWHSTGQVQGFIRGSLHQGMDQTRQPPYESRTESAFGAQQARGTSNQFDSSLETERRQAETRVQHLQQELNELKRRADKDY